MVAIFAINLSGTAFSQIAPNLKYFIEGTIAAQRMSGVIDRVPKIDIDKQGGEEPKSIEGYVELRNVSFYYPSRPDLPVFHDFSLKIEKGITLALAG